MNKENIIKGALAIFLFLCLAKMPYSYFQFVRFTSFLAFSYLAYLSNKNNGKSQIAIVYVLAALLFQPFFKVALGRNLWNIIDVVVGCYLLFSILPSKNRLK